MLFFWQNFHAGNRTDGNLWLPECWAPSQCWAHPWQPSERQTADSTHPAVVVPTHSILSDDSCRKVTGIQEKHTAARIPKVKPKNSAASDTGTIRIKLSRKRRTYVQVSLSHFLELEAFCIFPLTSASATAASRSVLVLRTRMAFTEAGILPGCPSPNRSAQRQQWKGLLHEFTFTWNPDQVPQ